ncbi:MAG: molybdopterin-guanine dinucleotide biosynthesis protein B [Gammaproteobacteria bacterium]|nr:molybdopterin-guanine dinucleotide biosynthesis protein B [Gammaproteobacteria bacterium]
MRVFGIAGFKNAGKTTLVVELIRELTGRGLRLATIKHAHHEFDIDHPGKDSYLHRDAGASEVIVGSARRWAHIRELDNQPEPDLDELLSHLGDVDLVLIEGFKHGEHPRLEIRREGSDAPLIAAEHASVKAVVSDGEVPDSPVPVMDRSNVAAIADFILQQTGLR